MQTVFYMVGIPGSGKSHFAETLAKKEQAVILSSDEIRQKLFGDSKRQIKTNLVYRTLYEKLNQCLLEGKSVIVDATNIEASRRMFSLNKLPKDVKKVCYYFDTPYEVCIERNNARKRKVEPFVLEKMRKGLEFPILGEGFDEVNVVHSPKSYATTKEKFISLLKDESSYEELFHGLNAIPIFKEIYRFNQENPHHQFLLCEHTYYVYQYVNEYYEGDDKLVLQTAALFHDIGKPFCKKFKPLKGYCSYYGHENVSAQIASHFLYELGFEQTFIHEVLNLIQLHMLINYGGDEGASQIYHLVGGETLTKLYFFREGDRFAK